MAQLTLERGKTAVLIMDYQNDILGGYPEAARNEALQKAGAVLAKARGAGMPVVYVVVRFREGYPEIGPYDFGRLTLKQNNVLREGTPGAEIHSAVAPLPGEAVCVKRRTGPFSTSDLAAVLAAKGVTNLVLMGVATSGVVLSTVRWGSDTDYRMTVLADCCLDRDPEVHRVLTEKVFPRQAVVATAQELLDAAL